MKAYKTAVENLQAARRLLRTRWTRYTLARDKNHKSCSPRSPKAHSFCALGVVRHVNGPGELKALKVLRQAARDILKETKGNLEQDGPNSLIFRVNDSYGKELTLKMFARAIQIAKQ